MKYLLLLLFTFNAVADEVLTRDERIVALTILGEARGEGKSGMYAVGCVLQKRASERNLTPAKVCLEPWQFSIWNAKPTDIAKGSDGRAVVITGKTKKETELYYLWHSKSTPYARQLARAICQGKKLDQKFTGNANHYHSKKMKKKPYWTKGKTPAKVIGNHIFYKL